jgi:hypothetical protein
MKRIYFFFAVAIITLATACSKEKMNTFPTDQVSEGIVFTSLANIEKALNGAYRATYNQFTNQHRDGHGAVMILMDAMGEDYVRSRTGYTYHRGAYRWEDHRNPSSANVVGFVWDFYYLIVGNLNKILDNIDEVEGDPARKARIKAEALTLRAWAHHYLIQLYAKRYQEGGNNTQPGIPINLTHSITSTGRGTVEAAYQAINDDLDQAISIFGGAIARTLKTHINISVAQGVKARVLLTQHRYAEAALMAKAARESFASETNAGEAIMSENDYFAGFSNLSNVEWMWGVQQLEQQVPTYGGFFRYMSSNINSGFTRTNPKSMNSVLWQSISPTDYRRKLWWDGTTADRVNFPGVINAETGNPVSGQTFVAYQHKKYVTADYRFAAGDIPFMRTSEMYLIEAEGYARSEQYGLAQQTLFTLISKRDPDYVLSTNTGAALINEVMHHRRVELWGEGFRFLDLKRTNSDLDRRNANHTSTLANVLFMAAGANEWTWMLPISELNDNPNLTLQDQNP